MPDIYTSGFSSRKERRPRDFRDHIVLLSDTVMMSVSVTVWVLAFLCLIIPFFRPSVTRYLSVLPLAAPIVYLVMLVCTFYWIARWRIRRFITALSILLIVSFSLSMYYGVSPSKHYPGQFADRNAIKVLSYNVGIRYGQDIVDYVCNSGAQIVCLQELIFGADSRWNLVSEKFPNSTLRDSVRYANAIYTTLPIVRSGLIDSLSRHRAVWADVKIKNDTVRIINLHLRKTDVAVQETQKIRSSEQYEQGDSIVRSMVARLSASNIIRAAEAERVREFIDRTEYMTIVAGDFNDIPLSYTYRKIRGNMVDAFRKKGSGYACTFMGFRNLLRIDYIFYSKEITPYTYTIDNVDFSDHYPIVSKFKILKE